MSKNTANILKKNSDGIFLSKAIEITDAKISFVSLVDKAANKRQFLITKANGDEAKFSTIGKILKVDAETHYVTGIVYEPLVEDADGNYCLYKQKIVTNIKTFM